jgi:hypothetical protein
VPDRPLYIVEPPNHVVVPEPDHAVAVSRDGLASPSIFGHSVDMMSAVELDRELVRRAREIGDERSDRVLAAKSPLRPQLVQDAP